MTMGTLHQDITNMIAQFVEKKYKSAKTIACRFDVYYIGNTERCKNSPMEYTAELTIEEYTTLMKWLLLYPDLTFQDLPMLISKHVYFTLLQRLDFPFGFHFDYPHSIGPFEQSEPRAVEMTTLQHDVRELEGSRKSYCFDLPPKRDNDFEGLWVKLRLNWMSVGITEIKYYDFICLTFNMIDVFAVEKVLGVSDFKGVEKALRKIYRELSPAHKSNLFWLLRWLNDHQIEYESQVDYIC